MKIHHLNCGKLYPMAGRFLPGLGPRHMICHCLLVETPDRLVLVDTGFGTEDLEEPSRLGTAFHVLGVERATELTAIKQVQRLGFSPGEVTDVIATHLDPDHAGGISDFKWATIHVSDLELRSAQSPRSLRLKSRYRTAQLASDAKWRVFDLRGESWHGFASAQQLDGLPPELLLVQLPGHTPGHFGVAISGQDGWLLHAGDAYYDHRELTSASGGSPGLKLFERVAHHDFSLAMQTLSKLRELRGVIRTVCSHDPVELPTDRREARSPLAGSIASPA